jgi:hypothetical protein
MLSGRTTTTISQPAPGRMDYNAGKPVWRELLPLFGVVLVALAVAAAGVTGLIAAWPRDSYEASAWHWLGMATGAAFAWGGGTVAWSLRATLVRSYTSWQDRLADWHEAELEKYREGDGRLVAQQVSEWAYNPLDLRSLLLGYVAVLATNPAKLTIDALQKNGLWMKIEHRDMKVLTFTQDGAEQFLALLARARVIEGRGPRQSGRVLIDEPRDQVLRLLKMAAASPEVQAALAAREGL